MADNALAKAAEAIGGYVHGRYCSRCRVASVANCPTCPAEQLRNDDGLDLARAVLEAGVEQSGRTCATCKWWERESQEGDPKTGPGLWWGLCHVTSERMEVDGDLECWAELRTREDFGCVCWAALERAGKE